MVSAPLRGLVRTLLSFGLRYLIFYQNQAFKPYF